MPHNMTNTVCQYQFTVPRVPVTFMGYRCCRCSHQWVPNTDVPPLQCPACKSSAWHRARKK